MQRTGRLLIFALLLVPLAALSSAEPPDAGQQPVPGAEWAVLSSPQAAGWNAAKLQEAREYAGTIQTAAVMVVHRGHVVSQWGETARPFMCHSIRKSLLTALYGPHVAAGTIDLDATLRQLGIDDNEPSLTDQEKTATVRQLLQARSGIYHPALYETASMAAARPPRHSHAPGTFWYYNNWDFNAAGAIFEQRTARSIFEEFERLLAEPLGMQDFVREEHTEYVTGADSVYPAYPFTLSARDLARFGLLYAREGRWGSEQLLPADWVAESVASYSSAGGSGGYGYMWWVAADGRHYPNVRLPDGAYSARGAGGHHIVVVPQWDLVVVHRVNTFRPPRDSVSGAQFGRLLNLILEARPAGLAFERATAPASGGPPAG